MLVRPQLQAAGGYLVWVGAGLVAVEGSSSKLVVDEAPQLPPRRPAARRLVPAAVATFATVRWWRLQPLLPPLLLVRPGEGKRPLWPAAVAAATVTSAAAAAGNSLPPY